MPPIRKKKDSPEGEFWHFLLDAVNKGKELILTQGTFLGSEAMGSHLFIRKAYKDLIELIKNDWAKGKHTLLLGTPGIGKSTFMCYVLWILRRSKVDIVVQRRGESCYLYKSDGTVEEGTFEQFKDYCAKSDSYLLADGVVPQEGGIKSHILEVSSPRKEFWLSFQKRMNVVTRYMPTWSLTELLECRNNCYSSILEQTVINNFKIFGGTVRHVLAKSEDPSAKDAIIEALARTDIQAALDSDGMSGAPDDVSSLILHWTVVDAKTMDKTEEVWKDRTVKVEDYDRYVCEFGSHFIRQKVLERGERSMKNYLSSFIQHSGENVYFGQLCGRLFEDIAHQILQKGGNFTIRQLGTEENKESSLNLKISGVRDILVLGDIGSCEDGHYLQPIASNFPSIDSLIYPDRLFQMMTGRRHGIGLKGLKKILDQLPKGVYPVLYFVTPKQNSNRILNQQPYTLKKAVVPFSALPKWAQQIKQYVLEIHVGPDSNTSIASPLGSISPTVPFMMSPEAINLLSESIVQSVSPSFKPIPDMNYNFHFQTGQQEQVTPLRGLKRAYQGSSVDERPLTKPRIEPPLTSTSVSSSTSTTSASLSSSSSMTNEGQEVSLVNRGRGSGRGRGHGRGR